jgi:diphthamide synthase (EF-2-diphthine--ammonia ligase)
MDVHKDSIAVAYIAQEHGAEVTYLGTIGTRQSELIHTGAVKPALALLHGKEFAGAQEEFLKAHEHYRQGKSKEALAECLKAFESVMKVICIKRKWAHSPHANNSAAHV